MKTIDELLTTQNKTDDKICDIVLAVIKTRQSMHMSSDDLAKKAGIGENSVKLFESFAFSTISLDDFIKILSALNMQIKIIK